MLVTLRASIQPKLFILKLKEMKIAWIIWRERGGVFTQNAWKKKVIFVIWQSMSSIDCKIPLASDNRLSPIIINNFNNVLHDPTSVFTNFMDGNEGEDLPEDASPDKLGIQWWDQWDQCRIRMQVDLSNLKASPIAIWRKTWSPKELCSETLIKYQSFKQKSIYNAIDIQDQPLQSPCTVYLFFIIFHCSYFTDGLVISFQYLISCESSRWK